MRRPIGWVVDGVMTRGGGEGSGWARSRTREFAWATGYGKGEREKLADRLGKFFRGDG